MLFIRTCCFVVISYNAPDIMNTPDYLKLEIRL